MQQHKQPLDYAEYQDGDDPEEDKTRTKIRLVLLFAFIDIAEVLIVRPYNLILSTLRLVRQWSPNK